MEARLLELEKRVRRAERQTRAAMLAGISIGVGTMALLTAMPASTQAANEPATVKAPFRVLDSDGKTALEVSVDKDGPFLRMFDARKQQSAIIWSDASGGNININGANGKAVAALVSRGDGAGGELTVYGKGGVAAAAMFARGDGAGGNIRVNDAKGVGVGALFARDDGAGGNLGIYDKNGKSAVALLSRPDGAGGDVAVYNPAGKSMASLVSNGKNGQLVLRDDAGGELFSKP